MSTGLGMVMAMPGLTLANKRSVTSSDDTDAQVDAGTVVELNDGREFRYVRANEAMVIGQIVRGLYGDVAVANIDAYDAAALTITEAAGFTLNRYNGAREEYYVYANLDLGFGQTRRIVSNTAGVLTIDAAFGVALDATTDITIFSPYRMQLTSAATQVVKGVVLSALTAGNFGWVQKKGFNPQVRCIGTADPTILHEIVVSSGTAGACRGRTAGGITATEVSVAFGSAMTVYNQADTAGRGVCVDLDCK